MVDSSTRTTADTSLSYAGTLIAAACWTHGGVSSKVSAGVTAAANSSNESVPNNRNFISTSPWDLRLRFSCLLQCDAVTVLLMKRIKQGLHLGITLHSKVQGPYAAKEKAAIVNQRPAVRSNRQSWLVRGYVATCEWRRRICVIECET